MKFLYVTTVSSTINAFLIPHIEMLKLQGHEIDIVTSMSENLNNEVRSFTRNIFDVQFNRNPLSPENITAFRTLKKILKTQKYDVIHVHTPIASALTRFALGPKSNTKLIYTAHGFHFFKGAPKKNWLIYYTIEKLLAKKTDILITMNQEDFESGKKLGVEHTFIINGVGIDLKKFSSNSNNYHLKLQLGIEDEDKVFLSVGELNKNKNHRLVIEAFSKIDNLPFKYYICGKGAEKENLENLIKKYNLEKNIFLLGFRDDINELMKVADCFIFPSRREGLPVSVMEAMASGLPIVASNIRGNKDLVIDEVGGLLFENNNLNDLVDKLRRILNESKSKEQEYSNFNIQRIKRFAIGSVLQQLNYIYEFVAKL